MRLRSRQYRCEECNRYNRTLLKSFTSLGLSVIVEAIDLTRKIFQRMKTCVICLIACTLQHRVFLSLSNARFEELNSDCLRISTHLPSRMSAAMRCDWLSRTTFVKRPATDVANGVGHRTQRDVVAEGGVGIAADNSPSPSLGQVQYLSSSVFSFCDIAHDSSLAQVRSNKMYTST